MSRALAVVALLGAGAPAAARLPSGARVAARTPRPADLAQTPAPAEAPSQAPAPAADRTPDRTPVPEAPVPTLETGAGGESCTVPAPPGGLSLSMVAIGLRWSGWSHECELLYRYLDLGAPPATAESGRGAERLLVATGYFKAARCEPADGGARLACLLAPADIVRDVKIAGKLPFTMLEQEVRQRIFLRPGVLLENEGPRLTLQGRRLTDYLVDEGYFDSHVTMQTRPVSGAEPNRGVEVLALVGAGTTAKVRDIWVRGDQVVSAHDLGKEFLHYGFLFLGTRRFQPAQFRQDLERATKLVQNRGWPEARLDGTYTLDRATKAVDVVLQVQAGPRLDLRFVGNRTLHAHQLAEVATFGQAGIIDEVEIQKTAEAIVEAYQKKGFYEPKVTYRTLSGVQVYEVTYAIEEGPQADIAQVDFTGNLSFTEAELRDLATVATAETSFFYTSRWVDTWVAHDVLALETFYRDAGFAEVKVGAGREVRPDGRLRAVFTIHEGPRRRVAAVSFEGLPPGLPASKVTSGLKLTEAAPFSPSRLEDDRRSVLAALGAAGYTHGEAKQLVFPLEPGELGNVAVHYVVTPGDRAYFRGLLVRGNFRTARSLIDHTLGLDPGDPLDLVKVGRAQRRLRDLGIFTSVEVRPLGQWRGAADTWLLTAVQERSARSVNAVLSFATDELFSVGADYLDTNLFGRAVRLDSQLRLSNASEVFGGPGCGGPVDQLGATGIKLKCGRIGNRDLAQVMLRAPRPFELPADFEATAMYDYQDKPVYRERRLGATASLLRAFGVPPRTTVALGYELVSAYFYPRVQTITQPPPTATIGRIVPRGSIDHRDSPADPRKGFRLDLRLEVAHHALAGPLPHGASFLRAIGSASAYVGLARVGSLRLRGGEMLGGPVVLAMATSVGAARPWAGDKTIPPSEAFYYGGDQSVRGLPDRASAVPFQSAPYVLTGSLELRWYFWQGLGFGALQFAPFVDAGTVWGTMVPPVDKASLGRDLTVSVGSALRYVTPVGPISLAYGKPVRWPAGIPGGGRIHFSFGYTF